MNKILKILLVTLLLTILTGIIPVNNMHHSSGQCFKNMGCVEGVTYGYRGYGLPFTYKVSGDVPWSGFEPDRTQEAISFVIIFLINFVSYLAITIIGFLIYYYIEKILARSRKSKQ